LSPPPPLPGGVALAATPPAPAEARPADAGVPSPRLVAAPA
jgi:hypothetical protein